MAAIFGANKVVDCKYKICINLVYLFFIFKDEFVTSLAALALFDGDAEVTSDNISTLLAASNNVVAPYWPALFAGLLGNGRIDALVATGGVGAGAAAPAAAGQ
jgi:ribosomal protein L12E/L44/L45/RPP1/RPP2